jgi:hypothetical protein
MTKRKKERNWWLPEARGYREKEKHGKVNQWVLLSYY